MQIGYGEPRQKATSPSGNETGEYRETGQNEKGNETGICVSLR